MTTSHSATEYALGSTDAEHERLIWQAARVAPITERLFCEAGIGLGQRVLDIGSGVGDVAMLAARLGASSFREQHQEHCRHQHGDSDKGKAPMQAARLVFDQADGVRSCKTAKISEGVDEGNSRGSCISR